MSRTIRLSIPVDPVPMQRPRVTTRAGFAQAYIPAKSRNAKAMITLECRRSLRDVEPFHRPIPLAMHVVFYRARPQHAPKKVILPATKPDNPNYLMLICDALQGYAYDDDSQLTTILTAKRFGQPHIEIAISEDNCLFYEERACQNVVED